MQLSVFRQTMNESRLPILTWVLGLAGAVWLSLLAYLPALRLASGPDQAGRVSGWLLLATGSQDALVDLAHWAQAVTLGTVLPLLVAVFAVLHGSRLVAGEEENGLLALLLAAPVRRYQLVLQKFAVLLVLLLACGLGAWVAVSLVSWIGILPATDTQTVKAFLALFWFGMVFGSLALALGCLTGRYGLSRNILLGYSLLAFVISRMPASFPGQPVLRWVSPFSLYLLALADAQYWNVILALFGAACLGLALAWAFFERRDFPV